MKLNERLKEAREARNMSQEQVAEAVGVTKQAISKFEKGIIQPSAAVLAGIADALECSADYLLGRANQPQLS